MIRTRNTLRFYGWMGAMALALPLAAQENARPGAPPAEVDGRPVAAARPGEQQPAAVDRAQVTVNTRAGQDRSQFELGDIALARWLSIDQRIEIEVGNFAAQRAENPQVRQFAGQIAQSHRQLLDRLQQFDSAVPGTEAQVGQLDEALEEIGENLQQRLEQPRQRIVDARTGNDPNAVVRTESTGEGERTTLRERLQEAREERRADDGDRRARPILNRRNEANNDDAVADDGRSQPVRQEIAEQRDERQAIRADRREQRDESAAERQAIREQRRQDLRGFLRENLPDVLDVVGQAIQAEAEQTVNSPWVDFHQQLGQRKVASLKEELGRYQGAEFDQAYLGYQVIAHVNMIDAFELAQQTASPELQQVLTDGIGMAQGHLQQARRLMEQLASNAGNR